MSTTNLLALLSTRSKRALFKVNKKYGHPYIYSPRGDLLERLSKQTGMEVSKVYKELLQIRNEYLKNL